MWRVGNGLNVRIGIDLIVSINAPYLLPADLREYLADYGITHLTQAQNLDFGSHCENFWYSAANLNLGVLGLITGTHILKVLPMVE